MTVSRAPWKDGGLVVNDFDTPQRTSQLAILPVSCAIDDLPEQHRVSVPNAIYPEQEWFNRIVGAAAAFVFQRHPEIRFPMDAKL
jgi:hypothetical protein